MTVKSNNQQFVSCSLAVLLWRTAIRNAMLKTEDEKSPYARFALEKNFFDELCLGFYFAKHLTLFSYEHEQANKILDETLMYLFEWLDLGSMILTERCYRIGDIIKDDEDLKLIIRNLSDKSIEGSEATADTHIQLSVMMDLVLYRRMTSIDQCMDDNDAFSNGETMIKILDYYQTIIFNKGSIDEVIKASLGMDFLGYYKLASNYVGPTTLLLVTIEEAIIKDSLQKWTYKHAQPFPGDWPFPNS